MKKRILVADDEKDIGEFIKKTLERRGHSVDVASDGLHAHEKIQQGNYDVVLLDCSMPDMTGIELISVARINNPRVRVIIFSGYPAINERLIDDLGAHAFLEKPLTVEALERAIEG